MVDKSNEYGYVPSSPTQAGGSNTGVFEVNDIVDLINAGQWSLQLFDLEYLVIAGGGGGGSGSEEPCREGGSGGGAGGYRNSYASETSGGNSSTETPITITPGTSYTVTVGAGGPGAGGSASNGGNGNNSVFSTITSTGGGKGARDNQSGFAGGSGSGGGANGGGGGAGTGGQGRNGGHSNCSAAGGGGGASAVGVNATDSNGGAGGAGLSSSITGSSVTRAGGGGGGAYASGGAGGSGGGGAGRSSAGTVNTGGGGGGQRSSSAYNGGSGVVILRYPNTRTVTVGAGLTSSTSTDGDYKVTTFTEGTDTISFSQEIMAHYAFIKDNIVTEVIVGKDETETAPDGFADWEEYYLTKRPDQDACKRTSYNTVGNTHTDGGTPFRGNYASIGSIYDEVNDVFYPVKEYNSWLISEESNWIYYPPISKPELTEEQFSLNHFYAWDEDLYQADTNNPKTQGWVIVTEH